VLISLARCQKKAVVCGFSRENKTDDYTVGTETPLAGLWIMDPSQWLPGSAMEYPWHDPDEFFASAKEAYRLNRKGLERAVAKLKKVGRPRRAASQGTAGFAARIHHERD